MDIWFTLFVMLAALLVAVGGALLLVGYVQTLPASLSYGWRVWLPTLILPVVGPLLFARQHAEYARPGKQLLAGLLLVLLAAVLLFGAGPYFVERMALGAK